MLQYFVELLGTFIFLSVILLAVNMNVKWAAFPIGFALIAVIFFGGSVSGGHFNPAVSAMFYLNKSLPLMDLVLYILMQLLGAAFAIQYTKMAK